MKTTDDTKPRCGLCGKTKKLMKTDCCGQWICDDYDKYKLFSFARNSCARNHDRYTICSFHHHEEHPGNWQTCTQCRKDLDTEDYVDMVTNDYNFEKLPNPPSFTPTKCARCQKIIVRAKESYTMVPKEGIVCEICMPI